MNKEQLQQKIVDMEKQLAELKKELEKKDKGIWKPKKLENYWYIDNDGKVLLDNNGEYSMDRNKINFNNHYKTKEEAAQHKKFGNITRTETLKFPTWKQIENIIEQKKKFGLNHSDRVLARIITNDSIYYFKLCKDLDFFTLQLKQVYIGEDLCEEITTRFPVILGKATEQNYEKACEKCKQIFYGGEK